MAMKSIDLGVAYERGGGGRSVTAVPGGTRIASPDNAGGAIVPAAKLLGGAWAVEFDVVFVSDPGPGLRHSGIFLYVSDSRYEGLRVVWQSNLRFRSDYLIEQSGTEVALTYDSQPPNPAIGVPVRFRMERSGDVFTVYTDTVKRMVFTYALPPVLTLGFFGYYNTTDFLNGAIDAPSWVRTTRIASAPLVVDPEMGGNGRVYGDTGIKGDPADTMIKSRVRLYRQRDGKLARQQWSQSNTGTFDFRGMRVGEDFFAVAEHPDGSFRMVAADRLRAEVMP